LLYNTTDSIFSIKGLLKVAVFFVILDVAKCGKCMAKPTKPPTKNEEVLNEGGCVFKSEFFSFFFPQRKQILQGGQPDFPLTKNKIPNHFIIRLITNNGIREIKASEEKNFLKISRLYSTRFGQGFFQFLFRIDFPGLFSFFCYFP